VLAHHVDTRALDRRAFLATVGGGLLVAPLVAEAQPAGKVWRVGWLQPSPPASAGHTNFRQAMRELGYVPGENIAFEDRFADGDFGRLPGLATELVRSNLDVIVAVATGAIRAARNATRTIPIVMAFSGVDPVKAGFVASLNRPGGNVTGITMLAPELSAKRLDVLTQALPAARRVGVLGYRDNPGTAEQIKAVESAATRAGLTVQAVYVQQPHRYDDLFAPLGQQRIDAMLVLTDTVLANDRTQIVRSAMRHRLPTVFDFKESAEVGGIVSYGVNNLDLYRQAARFVDRLFKGAKPADLPVEQPTKFELVINLKTAATLGLTIPPALLQRADHVIE
jgi:putative tryptophan/tyrosine transport system substrate-binding protein